MYTEIKNKRKEFVKEMGDAEVLLNLYDLQEDITLLSIVVGDKRLDIDSIDHDQSLAVAELLECIIDNLKTKVNKIDAVLEMVGEGD